MVDLITMKKALEQKLIHIPGVMGVSADLSRGVIKVYVEDRSVIDRIKHLTKGYPVMFIVTGRVTI